MAGGSSDAACALFGMNRLFELNVPMRELMKLGVEIGADVPYCLMRGTALAGRNWREAYKASGYAILSYSYSKASGKCIN